MSESINIENEFNFFSKLIYQTEETSFVRKEFEGQNDPEYCYNKQKDVIEYQRQFPLGEAENEYEQKFDVEEREITYEEYVFEKIQEENNRLKTLIYNFRENPNNGKDEHNWFYEKVLSSIHKKLLFLDDNDVDFKDEIKDALKQVATYAAKSYQEFFPGTPQFLKMKEYMTGRKSILKSKKHFTIFKSNLNEAQLKSVFDTGISLKLISTETSSDDFIDAFSGWNPKNKIQWIGTTYSLARFIKQSEGYSLPKLGRGKWEIVSDIFCTSKHDQLTPDQLKHPSKGTNENLDSVNAFIAEFNDPPED
jgi:hypothetical protein